MLETALENAASGTIIPYCNTSKVKVGNLKKKRAGDEIKVKLQRFTGRHGRATTHERSDVLRHSVVIMDT